MSSEQTLEIMETITRYAEAFSGFRLQLIRAGYSPEIAEQLVLAVFQNKLGGNDDKRNQ